MKRYHKIISIIVAVLLMGLIGFSFGFFNYTRTGQNSKVIAGSLYLTLDEGTDSINIANALPETKEEARNRTGNTLTFTVKGKNTSSSKAINYEILLNNGTANANNEKQRINPKDLVFDLIEIGSNNTETYILDAVSYETLENQKIWVDKVDENTNNEIERTYKLRVWVSDDIIVSDTDPNRDYTTNEYKNLYASVKVAVEGDLEDKQVPLVTTVSSVLDANNQTYLTSEISNIDSENSQDTYTLTITSSNNNVEFIYNNDVTVSNISNELISGKVSYLDDDVIGKVKKLTGEVISSTFSQQFTIANNKKATFSFALRSTTGNTEVTDLYYTLVKSSETIQELVKHVTVVGYDKPVPHIVLVNKQATYTGSAVTLDSVTITNSDNTTYTGTTTYTYYKGNSCSGQEISSAPVKPGTYSVNVYAAGSGTDGSTSSCGTITINKKSLTPSILACTSRNYNGTTAVVCTTSVSGSVGGDVVSVSGTCSIASATVGNSKTATCSNLTLTGSDKDKYLLSANSVEKSSAVNITKTILQISADDKTMEAGSSAPTYTYRTNGFVNSETVSVLTGSISYVVKDENDTTVTVNSSTPVGRYKIVPSGFTSSNYDINYENGVLTITELESINPVLSDVIETYDGNPHSIGTTGGSGGIVQYRTSTNNSTWSEWSVAVPSLTNAGTLYVQARILGDANHNDTNPTETHTITINPKSIAVTADNKTMTYGGSAPSYSYTVTGAVNNETAVTGTVTYTIKSGNTTINNVSTADAGSYSIVPSGLTPENNYSVAYVNGTLTINRANTATLGSCKSPTYSGSSQDIVNHGNYVTYTGNNQTNVNTEGGYTVTVTPDANHAWSNGTYAADTLTCNIEPLQCNAPTNVSISSAGIITWTTSSNCSSAQHQVKVASGSYSNASSGVNKKSDIIAATGTRTIKVKAITPSANYLTSNETSGTIDVFSVTLISGTGITAVTGAGNYINGETVTLGATVDSNYTWSKWTDTSSGTQISTTRAYSATISGNWAYTANATINTLPSTLTVTNNSVSLTYGTNGENGYSYNGDGTVSCSSGNTSYVTCSVDSTNNKILLTPVAPTTSAVTITVSANATINYYAPTDATFTVTVAKITPTVTTSVSGTARWGETLTCSATNTGDGTSYTYAWYQTTTSGGTSGTAISGQTNSTYTIASDYIGKYIGCTATVAATTTYNSASAGKAQTTAVAKKTATNSVAITGTNTWGSTLTATITTNSDGTKGYKWYYSNTAGATSGGTAVGDTNCDTGSTCVIPSSLVGKYIYVVGSVGASDLYTTPSDSTDATDATANGTQAVAKKAATNSVTITGTNTYGSTLTASVTTNSNGTKSYQWYYNSSNSTSGGTSISGATGSTYKIGNGTTATLAGKYIYVKVSIAASTTYLAASDAYDKTDATNNTTAKVAKGASSITCKSSQGYTGQAVNPTYSASSGCASYTNGSLTNIGSYTVTCVGDDNHNNSTCSFSITAAGATAAPYIKQLGTSAGVRNVAGAYRYSGASVNNYVQYNGKKWRILGAYGDYLKIINSDGTGTATAYDTNTTNISTTFDGSTLAEYLNKNSSGGYYYAMGSTAKNMIQSGTWRIGQCNYADSHADAYSNSGNATMTANVGTMALYEYLYAADSSCDSTAGNSYAQGCAAKDWLKPSTDTWTLSRSTKANAIKVVSGTSSVAVTNQIQIMPAVYLKSTVKICSGSGTSGSPWIIATSC